MQQERLRALGQMASGIAHDINNAISPVALYTESLLEREPNLSARGARLSGDHPARHRRCGRDRRAHARVLPPARAAARRSRRVDLNAAACQQVLDLTRARWSDMPQQRGIVIRPAHRAGAGLARHHGRRERNPRGADQSGLQRRGRHAGGRHADLAHARARPDRRRRSRPRRCSIEVSDTGVGMDEETAAAAWSRSSPPRASAAPAWAWRWSMAWCSGTARSSRSKARRARARPCALIFAGCYGRSRWRRARPPPQCRRRRRLRILVVDDDPLLLKSLRDTLEATATSSHRRRRPGRHRRLRRGARSGEAVRRRDHRPRHALRRRPQGGRRDQGSRRRPRRSSCSPAGASAWWPKATSRRTWTACSASRPSCVNYVRAALGRARRLRSSRHGPAKADG